MKKIICAFIFCLIGTIGYCLENSSNVTILGYEDNIFFDPPVFQEINIDCIIPGNVYIINKPPNIPMDVDGGTIIIAFNTRDTINIIEKKSY